MKFNEVIYKYVFIFIGYGDRREIQYVPKESEKLALEWSGEEGFHQVRCSLRVFEFIV